MAEKYVRCARCMKLIGKRQIRKGKCVCGSVRFYGAGRISWLEKVKIWLGLLD